MFSAAFSRAWAGRGGYVCPVMAQALLFDGVASVVLGSALLVGGKKLIGPAGKVYAFGSPESAIKWAENAAAVVARERALMATIAPGVAAAWKAKKREKLAVIAGRVVDSAARQSDPAKRAALLAESDYCLGKWA